MAISDYKITAEDIAKYGVVSLPDTLTGDPQENKKKFDRLVRECVANAVNAVIDHMALVEAEAKEWSDAEAARVKAEAARVAAENLRIQAETARADAETARAAAETARALAENLRAEAEAARANAENKRDTAEKGRAAAESDRENAESARETAESQRANAENSRAQNESARVSAETGRADAEADRVSAEDTRIANEAARKNAETDRASAETARESGENARKSAEKSRESAEQQRESSESTRQTSENDRVRAEKSRADAETARQAAEAARNVWEEYSAGKAYVPGNKVSFNGSSYVCTANTTGHAPTDTAYWLLIAQKGADGNGAGDMLASVYDPQGKAQDVFDFAVSEAAKVQRNLAGHTIKTDNPHKVTAAQVGADPKGTAANEVSAHNTSTDAHSALFTAKQDKIKGKKGKYVGFTATDTVGEVDAPASGGSRITLTFASDFVGQTWTLKGGGETYTGTVDSSLTASVSVLGINTTYTLSCVLDGVTYTNEVATKDYYTALAVTLEKFQSTITVTIDSGSTVTATLGSTVLTKTSTGTAVFTVVKAGTWAIKATKGDRLARGVVEITASGQSKSLTLSYANVFGVCWDTSNSSTALTRLTPETDPYEYVTVSVTTEPKPAVGTGSGSSPFDSYAPWSGMVKTTMDVNVMVYIPAFYVAQKRSGTKQYFYVSDKAKTGFVKHPGAGKYVGRHHTNSNGHSVTDYGPWVDVSRAGARSLAKRQGPKYHLYDFATYCAIIFLYLVEFADWNCQSKIGRGYVDNKRSAISSGGTDGMKYHTGRASGTDGETSVQYRWIENLWSNVFQWVDGFNANGTEAYYCTDPSKYADDTTTGYTKIGTLPASGWIKDLTVTDNGLIIPKTTGGSDSTYIPDYASSSSGWRVLFVGGVWDGGSSAGLLCFYANYASSGSYSIVSARLLCEP